MSQRAEGGKRSDAAGRTATRSQPHWPAPFGRFPGGRDCLASFLAYESAEVLAGVKPANLVNLIDLPHACGRNFYRLWHAHGTAVLGLSELVAKVLVDRGNSLLLLVYDPRQLDGLLARRAVRGMLRRLAYPAPEQPQAVLAELQRRCSEAGAFPHEIGIILGYPLKDVAAFMGWVELPFVAQGPWRIYGQPERSLRLAAEHRRCREGMLRRLAVCASPFACLQRASGGAILPSCREPGANPRCGG